MIAKFCLKPVCETHNISSSGRLTYILSKFSPSFSVSCITDILWPKMLKYIYFSKCFHAVLYIVLKRHVPLLRFPETFSMWCRSIFGTKWHRFHYYCNLWWVQPLYCINTLDYYPSRCPLDFTLGCEMKSVSWSWAVIWWHTVRGERNMDSDVVVFFPPKDAVYLIVMKYYITYQGQVVYNIHMSVK